MFKQLSANSRVQNQLYKFPMSRCLHIICSCAHVFNHQYRRSRALFSTFAICIDCICTTHCWPRPIRLMPLPLPRGLHVRVGYRS